MDEQNEAIARSLLDKHASGSKNKANTKDGSDDAENQSPSLLDEESSVVSVIDMKSDAPQSGKKLSLRQKLNAKKIAKKMRAQSEDAQEVQKSVEDLAMEQITQ